MVGWSGQNRGLKADSCGFQKLSVVYSNSKNSGGQTHPKFAPKTMKPCQQTKTPLWVRSRPLDSPESEFNVRKSQDDGLPLEPCAISGGGCLTFPQIGFLEIVNCGQTKTLAKFLSFLGLDSRAFFGSRGRNWQLTRSAELLLSVRYFLSTDGRDRILGFIQSEHVKPKNRYSHSPVPVCFGLAPPESVFHVF